MPTDRGTWFMYHADTGEIYGSYTNRYENMLIDLEGMFYVRATTDDHDIANKYVDSGVVKYRPSMRLKRLGTTIEGIPSGATLILGMQEFKIDDGIAEIDGYSGTVRIVCWPYVEEVLEI